MSSHFLLFGLFLVTTLYSQVLSTLPYHLIRDNKSNKLYLIFEKTNIARLLPDNDQVATFLELRLSEAKEVDDMSIYTISDPAPTFTLPPPNPDTAIANMLARVNLLCPQTFWKKTQLINLFNPALVRWKDRYLIAYRNGTAISLAWMHHNAHDDSFEVLFNDFSHGLRDSHGQNPWNFSIGKYSYHEDPRLLVLHGGKQIALTFVRLRDARDTAEIAYINITMSGGGGSRHSTSLSGSSSGVQSQHTVSFSPETVFLTGRKQKNWTPFEHQGEQYWITSINPLHIVKHAKTVYDPTNADPLQAKMTTVYQSKVDIPLSWSASYGLPIRGGTPAIKVRGLYMAFFHTLSSFQTTWRLQTYFMGAVTFCPNYPFHVHSISRHPILQDFLYQGSWMNNHRDYVVFPAGIAVDDEEKHLYVSFGHQDAHAYIAKFDIDELLPTLEIVATC
eukprot:gene6634-7327_t